MTSRRQAKHLSLTGSNSVSPLVTATGYEHNGATERTKDLPRWPMIVLLAGFPIWWALGAAPFAPICLALVMLILMILKRQMLVLAGLLPWFAFLTWVLAAGINVPDFGTALGFLQRWGNLLAVGIFIFYYTNAKKNLNPTNIVYLLGVVWLTVVCLGWAAMLWPEFRLNTPVGAVLPGFMTKNPLVYDLVFPPLAEIQQPWGAPEPFNRPAAPFPYANSWGVAFALLTPCILALISMARPWWAKILVIVLLVLSFIPAMATSNRGMLLGLAIGIVYVTVRIGFRGQFVKLAILLISFGVATLILFVSGSMDTILGRQEYSDSTSGRLSIYEATLAAAMRSPFLGYGAPRMDSSIGISLGTQGYIWMLMFSFGFVGLGLFLYFLIGGIVRTWHAPGTSGLLLHGTLATALVIIPYYSLDVMQMTTVGLVLAVLLRAKHYDEYIGVLSPSGDLQDAPVSRKLVQNTRK